MNFQEALKAMNEGHAVRRTNDWPRNYVVFAQIPQFVNKDIIPKMTSVPETVKDLIMNNSQCISYHDQCIMLDVETGSAEYFVPTIKNCNADDWEIVTVNNY